jgi:hypothetical protein
MKRAKFSLLILVVLVVMAGCTVGQTGPTGAGAAGAAAQGIPWYEDIKNWTPHQKANFFMEAWEAQLADYKAQNAIPNKSPDLVKILNVKQQILEQSRIPVRQYVATVKGGQVGGNEMEIITWIRQLQTLALQYVK